MIIKWQKQYNNIMAKVYPLQAEAIMDEIINLIKNNILFKNMNEEEIKKVLKCANAFVESYI